MEIYTLVPTLALEKRSRAARLFAPINHWRSLDMSTIIDACCQPAAVPAGGGLSQILGRGTHFLRRAIRTRRDRAHLYEMPDHMLKDIGISRCEILWVTKFGRRD
jgi:uncharacterized protein YjiS (DUF1127 family)